MGDETGYRFPLPRDGADVREEEVEEQKQKKKCMIIKREKRRWLRFFRLPGLVQSSPAQSSHSVIIKSRPLEKRDESIDIPSSCGFVCF